MEHFTSPEMSDPGALAGASGAMNKSSFRSEEYRLRAERATALALALREAHPDDAGAICFGFLSSMETGGPEIGSLGITVSDARMWAEIAPPHELLAYTTAGIAELRCKPLPLTARKRLFATIWAGFPTEARRAFLRKIAAAGVGRAA